MDHIVLDTETTGLLLPKTAPIEKQPRIIELAFVRVRDGEIVSEHEWLIHPEQEITAEITKITGIKNEDLIGKPKFADLVTEIAEAMKDAATFIAHNAPFDSKMVKNELTRIGAIETFPFPAETVCTIQEYRHEYGRRMKLTELYEKKLGKSLAQTHRALDDVKALVEVLIADKFFEKFNDPA